MIAVFPPQSRDKKRKRNARYEYQSADDTRCCHRKPEPVHRGADVRQCDLLSSERQYADKIYPFKLRLADSGDCKPYNNTVYRQEYEQVGKRRPFPAKHRYSHRRVVVDKRHHRRNYQWDNGEQRLRERQRRKPFVPRHCDTAKKTEYRNTYLLLKGVHNTEH